MNWRSVMLLLVVVVVVAVMVLAALFGKEILGGRNTQPETAEPSFISGDEKFQIPQAYIPSNPVKYPDDYCQQYNENDEFDYVVIGAGPSGATVARRLAEDPTVRVLLMEAGGDPPPQSDIPSKYGQVDYEGRWHFNDCVHTEEKEQECNYVPGKFLGGSTIVNIMNYVRGNRQDFDDWEKIGCRGWSYNEVLPYFRKSETYNQYPLLSTEEVKKIKNPKVADKKYHGTKGPMHVSDFQKDPFTDLIRDAITKAQIENGIKYNPDINGADQMGVTKLAGMIDPIGYRNSAAKAFLLYIPDNLKVCKYSTAVTLQLHEKNVTGVNFQYNGTGEVKNYVAKAKREYIISAGPFNSAPLLERSGIGKRDVLEKLGIEVKHELPGVGENFQNHFSARILFKANFLSEASKNPLNTAMGYFASFINTTDPKSSVPDVELIGSALSSAAGVDSLRTLEETTKELKAVLASGQNILAYSVIHIRHPNPGSIHITQAQDPQVSPRIITHRLTTQVEKERIVKAVRTVRKFMSSEVLKPFNVEPLVIHECREHEYNTEDEILCHVRILTLLMYHACGTTAMGPEDNPNSVVDPKLRIIGLKNVRIVDSGVIPLIVRGHTTAASFMIGEKAADIIKKDWK